MIYDEKKQKWEKQPKEPKNAYKYFSFYLTDQCKSPRGKSYDNVCTNFSITKTTVYNYANKFDWEKRADAYNQYLAEQQQKEFEREYKKRCKETFMQIGATSQIIGQKLNSIMTQLKQADGDTERIKDVIGNLTLPQIVQVLKMNQDTMKMIMGIPDKQEVSMNGNVATTVKQVEEDMTEKLSKLSPEKREEYLALQAELNDEGTD